MPIDHIWCGGHRAPSNTCQVHWWQSDFGGDWIAYPIRVPNWAVIREWTFEEAPPFGDPGEVRLDNAIIVYVGPAAPLPDPCTHDWSRGRRCIRCGVFYRGS